MINVALFGFGRIGQMHAQNINQNKSLKLLYVYEKIDKLSKKAKKLYNCIIENNYKKIYSDKKVDIIFISSPTNTHIKFIEEGIKYNKTIFCEKPLDLNIQKFKTFILTNIMSMHLPYSTKTQKCNIEHKFFCNFIIFII